MNNQVNLEDITDVNELYKLKSDSYDTLEAAQQQVQMARNNISMINARIGQLRDEAAKQAAEPEKAKK